MSRTFKDSLKHRRTYYSLSDKSPISDAQIEEIVRFASEYVPSAFNSHSARMILLLGKQHSKFWDMVREAVKASVSPKYFAETDKKITNSFTSGYGTVLFFEDNSVVEKMQQKFPSAHDLFPDWSHHTSAMHQLTVWTMLEEEGFGASLQHYNQIGKEVCKAWNLPDNWTLIAQMPFGLPSQDPDEKAILPSGENVRVFK